MERGRVTGNIGELWVGEVWAENKWMECEMVIKQLKEVKFGQWGTGGWNLRWRSHY